MKIVEIKPRRKHICGIVFDCDIDLKEYGAEADPVGLLALDAQLCELKGLRSGMVLDDEELVELIRESSIKRAKSRAMWYISRQDMPKEKLRRKLAEHFPDYAAKAATDRAVELGLIDDFEYAKRRLQLELSVKKISLKAAAAKLLADGVDRETVEAAVEESEYDPTDSILTLIERKYTKKLCEENGREKVFAALMRRGYSYSQIKAAFNSLEDDWND
ncbi:MAG: regulatory protein RecX [Ruminococcaceae bacterium]|nr:regulatory protein RecX [Oscillospiraceae bacterium]